MACFFLEPWRIATPWAAATRAAARLVLLSCSPVGAMCSPREKGRERGEEMSWMRHSRGRGRAVLVQWSAVARTGFDQRRASDRGFLTVPGVAVDDLTAGCAGGGKSWGEAQFERRAPSPRPAPRPCEGCRLLVELPVLLGPLACDPLHEILRYISVARRGDSTANGVRAQHQVPAAHSVYFGVAACVRRQAPGRGSHLL